eukprot:Clim_evm4s158 gene=Clim_evmTU4s158
MSVNAMTGSPAHVAMNAFTGSIRIVNYHEEAFNVTTTDFARSQLFAPGTLDANGYAIAEESQTLTLSLTADQEQCSNAGCQPLVVGDNSFQVCYSLAGEYCVPQIPSTGYNPMPTGETATSIPYTDESGYQSVSLWICSTYNFGANHHLCPGQVVEDTWDIQGDLNYTYSEFQIVNDLPWTASFWWSDDTKPSIFFPSFLPSTHNAVLGVPARTTSETFSVTQITEQCNGVQDNLNVYWDHGYGFFSMDFNGDLHNNTDCSLQINEGNSHICPYHLKNTANEVIAGWYIAGNCAGTPRLTLIMCTSSEYHNNGGSCPNNGDRSFQGSITTYLANATLCNDGSA